MHACKHGSRVEKLWSDKKTEKVYPECTHLGDKKKKIKYVLIGPAFVETDLLQFYLVAEGLRLSLLSVLN